VYGTSAILDPCPPAIVPRPGFEQNRLEDFARTPHSKVEQLLASRVFVTTIVSIIIVVCDEKIEYRSTRGRAGLFVFVDRSVGAGTDPGRYYIYIWMT